jgi:hypothetical protein
MKSLASFEMLVCSRIAASSLSAVIGFQPSPKNLSPSSQTS